MRNTGLVFADIINLICPRHSNGKADERFDSQ